MFTALLDTCVLWPSLQRDVLLSLAAEGMYRPVWSSAILAELHYAETAKHVRNGDIQEVAAARAARLVIHMRRAFNDAEISGWEGLEGTYGLPDPDDEHVLAAAVVAGAGAIVTLNLRDFPADRLPLGIQTLTPAQFAAETVSLDPRRALDAIRSIAHRSGRSGPPRTVDELLDVLATRYHFHDAVDLLRSATLE
jgi:predicted nucleic acid-binding protein